MRRILSVVLASFAIVGQSQLALSQQPISKGEWAFKKGKPESVTFVYGTALTAEDIDRLSGCTSLARIVIGYAGVDSEYVEIEGDLLKLGQLKNLEEVHLCKDGIIDDDLKFIALLPKIHTLEFNADNGHDNARICTDRCADHIRSAKTLRSLVIHDGRFTDKFVARSTEGLSNLEVLSLNSAELTDESLRLLSECCRKLKSLSIASDHFTAEGLRHLDKLKNLKKRAVSSPALRKRSDPKEVSKLLGTWEYVSATNDGKPVNIGKDRTITLTEGRWALRENGKLIGSSTWEIDSTRSPKWLTQFTRGGKVNFEDRWVYKFDEQQLVLCKSLWMEERQRPDRFESRKGDKQYLLVLRRKETAAVDPQLERLKSDQDLAVAWFRKEWMARVEYSEGRVTGLVFPGFSNVNDDVLDVVATFHDLESLSVVGAQITSSGWQALARLRNLKKLVIISTKTFTDAGMKSLAGLKKLEVLDLSSTKKVTDAGIESLSGLTNLRDVDLGFTKITDRSLALLRGNVGLERIWLTATPVSDEGMKLLVKFRRLRHVDLQSTNVTDVGLQRLRACKELRQLSVNSTKITKEGAKRFHSTLPKCEIVFAPTDIGG